MREIRNPIPDPHDHDSELTKEQLLGEVWGTYINPNAKIVATTEDGFTIRTLPDGCTAEYDPLGCRLTMWEEYVIITPVEDSNINNPPEEVTWYPVS